MGAGSLWQPAGVTVGLSLRWPQRLAVSRHTRACLIERESHLEIILHVLYVIYVFDLIIHLLVWEYITHRFLWLKCGTSTSFTA